MSEKKDLYKESGVDVDKGDALVDWLQESGKIGTHGGEVVAVAEAGELVRADGAGIRAGDRRHRDGDRDER